MRRLLFLALIPLMACANLSPEPMVEEPVMAAPAVMEGAAPEPEETNAGTALRTDLCEDIDAGDGIGGTGCPTVE